MADFGARVIKVETHLKLDAARMGGPFYQFTPGYDRCGWQMWLNAGKYSMTVNLGKSQAADLIRRLIQEWQPNIITESFRPGVMKKWGLDYENVRELKPDVIYYSTCLEGQYGPHSMRLGYGTVSTFMSGVNHWWAGPTGSRQGCHLLTEIFRPPAPALLRSSAPSSDSARKEKESI